MANKKPLLGIPTHIRVTDIVKNQSQTPPENSRPELAGLSARERLKLESESLVREQLHKPCLLYTSRCV